LIVDFESKPDESALDDNYVLEKTWSVYGILVNGYPKSGNSPNNMTRVNVTNPAEGLGNVLILQTQDPVSNEAVPDPTGGDIVFQFGDFSNRVTEITLFNIEDSAEVILEHIDGSITTVAVSAMVGVQTINLDAYDVLEMTVKLNGVGAVASVGVCIDKAKTPAPVGFNINGPEPTPAPTATPQPTSVGCPEDIELIHIVGETEFPEMPIVIIEQNTRTIKFQVHNTFSENVTSIYTQFHEAPAGATECFEDNNVAKNNFFEYTAYCMFHVPITIVDIWVMDDSVLDGSVDDAVVPICCHPPEAYTNPVVQYTFKLRCVTECPEDIPTRRELTDKKSILRSSELLESQVEALREALTAELPDFKDAAVDVHANEPSTDGQDGHFCLSEDYPCGEEGDMVHVCHYSAKDGYQTFCVRESDSDVLRFYAKDYCGRCVGGYA
jgi:hypothetical protein